MQYLPFRNVTEAKENASALKRALQFYSVHTPDPEGGNLRPIGLQQTQSLIAKALGYSRWEDMTFALKSGAMVLYFDQCPEPEDIRRVFASVFSRALGAQESADAIKGALFFSAFGCTAETRHRVFSLFKNIRCQTIDQWRELIMLEAGYDFASRYPQMRSRYENALLRYNYEKAVSKVLGTPPPRKPRKPRGH